MSQTDSKCASGSCNKLSGHKYEKYCTDHKCYARHCSSEKNSESAFCDFHQCTAIDCRRKKYFMKKYNNQDTEYAWSWVCYKHKCQFETTPGAWYQRTFCLNERGFDSDYCDEHACNFCPNKIYQEDVEVCSEHRCGSCQQLPQNDSPFCKTRKSK